MLANWMALALAQTLFSPNIQAQINGSVFFSTTSGGQTHLNYQS